ARLERGALKYLISVDIFNEGIDIPCVDQIILLRDTRSKIVFTQQLGRGLRLFPGKTSALILDFIGNYQNNYLIPQALTNDRSLNKDRLVADLKEQVVYGLSTINFDEIAYQKILAVIARTKLDSLKHLKEAYFELSQKLGRIPMRRDFYHNSQLDPQIFTQGNTLVSYADFLDKLG
ncbi:NgoFVII family restriction endonuclease, partial [Campylobacter jejuni]|nr:NgoFVII family restriction endonuclease [Campylobacter jejuni]